MPQSITLDFSLKFKFDLSSLLKNTVRRLRNDVFRISSNNLFLIFLVVFGLVFCSISLVNHYNFRTSAFDLGLFNHALYSASKFQLNYFTLDLNYTGTKIACISDHFSPVVFLFTPLTWLFGSYTLLIVQIVSILLGAIGIYRLAQLKLPGSKIALLFPLLFLTQWSIYSALAFDFHMNVLAAMAIPWFFFFYQSNQKGKTIACFVFVLLTKENMALWLMFILLGLIFHDGFKNIWQRRTELLRYEIPLLLTAFAYFMGITFILMPSLNPDQGSGQLVRFEHLGDGFSSIIHHVFTHPIDTIRLFFESNTTDPETFGIKKELHIAVLFSGGIALILRPVYFVMLLPVYALKLLSNDPSLWGISYQYSIEFAPILTLAVIDAFISYRKFYFSKWLLILLVCSTTYFSYIKLSFNKTPWYDFTTLNFLNSAHYSSGGLAISDLKKELEKIPKNIPLSVSSNLAPHMANREKLYLFPALYDAEMIVLIPEHRSYYPLLPEQFKSTLNELIQSQEFDMIVNQPELIVLKRKKGVTEIN